MANKLRKHQIEEQRRALVSFVNTLSNVLQTEIEDHQRRIAYLEETQIKLKGIRSCFKNRRGVVRALLEFAAIALKHKCIDSYFYCAEGFLRRNLIKLLKKHGDPHLHGEVARKPRLDQVAKLRRQ